MSGQPIAVRRLTGSITVPERISRRMHPLVREARQQFGKGVRHHGRVTAGREGLDIRVSPQQVGRACRLMDTIIKVLEQHGAQVVLDHQDEWKRSTYASVDGEKVYFGLEESLKIIQTERDSFDYTRQEFVPNGKLVLRIKGHFLKDCRSRWADGKRGILEQKLASFINGLSAAAVYLKQERQEREEQQRRWEEERKEREQRLQALEEEKQRQRALEQQALSWQKSRLLRAYIRAVVRQQGQYAADSEFARWVEWASTHADQLNPLRQSVFHGAELVEQPTMSGSNTKDME